MASPQIENGYVRLANELVEAVYRFPFTGTQIRAVLWVMRHSYGWRRKITQTAGMTDIAMDTGVPRASVGWAVLALLEAKVLLKDARGRYSINKDHEQWIRAITKASPSNPLDTPVQPIGRKRPTHWTPPSNPLDTYKDKDNTDKDSKENNPPQATPGGRKLTPLQAVVRAYKMAKGLAKDDAAWDRANFKVHARSAKKLLEAFGGDDQAAVVYLLAKGEEWEEKGISWVLATVAKHAWDDRGKHGAGQGGDVRGPVGDRSGQDAVGADRVLDPDRAGGIASAGEVAGEALRRLGLRPPG